MPGKFEQTADLDPFIEELIERDHDYYHLKHSGVTVAVLFYWGEDGAPLKHGGYPAWATIKKTSPKDRAQGMRDALMVVDAVAWSQLTGMQRLALVGHELMHLEPVVDEWTYAKKPKSEWVEGESNYLYIGGEMVKESCTYEYDDHHRPKLRMRLHDIQEGSFLRCVEKWGEHSAEAQSFTHIRNLYGQLLFGAMATEAEIAASQEREHWRERGLPLTLPHIPKSEFMEEVESGQHDGENVATKKDHDRPAAATAK